MWVNEGARASQGESVHAAARMLFRHWESLRGSRSAPARQDLDLKQIRKLVPHLFIAEQADHGASFRWRLAGTAICGLFCREVTGDEVTAGWEAFEAGVIHRHLCQVTGTHQPALLRLRFTTDRAQSALADMAAFPILAADGASTHVLGGLFSFAEPPLKEYTRITALELLQARFAGNEAEALLGDDRPVQARRKFRVISGGLDPS